MGAMPTAMRAQSVTREQEVLSAIKLWGDIRYLDPRTPDSQQQLDMSFMSAEPKIRAATGRSSYLAAIDDWLFALHDPAIHVDRESRFRPEIQFSQSGAVAVVTISDAIEKGGASALPPAIISKSNAILFDLRGVDYANASAMSSLDELLSPDSQLASLVRGDVALPRTRTRTYTGYPNQNSSFDGYSASFDIVDPQVVHGTAPSDRRIGFLVGPATMISPTLLGLAMSGKATIYSIGGQPMFEPTQTATIALEYGLTATYRLGDIDGVERGDVVAMPVQSVAEAIGRMSEPAAPLRLARQGLATEAKDDPYGGGMLFPDEGLRILAVARIYNVIRYFSPYISLAHDDWNKAAERAISDEISARNTRDYLTGLMRFYAHLHDSHGVILGDMVAQYYGAGAPITVRYLRHQAVITAIARSAELRANIRVGDVIDAIDGVPTRTAMLRAKELINASTPQSANFDALRNYGAGSLLAGPVGSTVTLRYHAPSNSLFMSATVERSAGGSIEKSSEPIYTILPGNVGYVDLDRLLPSEVDGMFSALWNTKAIVFDNRGYPRLAEWPVAARLTSRSNVPVALFSTPVVSNPLDSPQDDISWLPSYRPFMQNVSTSASAKYRRPTVMLIDARSISQSEHTALLFRAAAGTRFVGTPTAGADGDVTSMVVPGAVTLNFSGEGISWPNGKQLQRVGIQPDRWAEPSALDIAKSNDVVLQAGLDEALGLSRSSLGARRAAVQAEKARELGLARNGPAISTAVVRGANDRSLQLTWTLRGNKFAAETTYSGGYLGGPAHSMHSIDGVDPSSKPFGSYGGRFDVTPYLGKTIRVRGYLSTENVIGNAAFWLRIDGPSEQLDNMQGHWLHGSANWTPFTIVLHVADNATQGVGGVMLTGTGKVSASDIHIDIVPDSTATTEI
jgi:C-terminal processing protease CtpA/Prc